MSEFSYLDKLSVSNDKYLHITSHILYYS